MQRSLIILLFSFRFVYGLDEFCFASNGKRNPSGRECRAVLRPAGLQQTEHVKRYANSNGNECWFILAVASISIWWMWPVAEGPQARLAIRTHRPKDACKMKIEEKGLHSMHNTVQRFPVRDIKGNLCGERKSGAIMLGFLFSFDPIFRVWGFSFFFFSKSKNAMNKAWCFCFQRVWNDLCWSAVFMVMFKSFLQG